MAERWLRDLRSLHTVVPRDDLWARVEEGPHGTPARIPNRRRVIAGGVAFTVFISAAVLAWNAFRPITQEALPPAGAPQAILAFNESDPQAPQLSMTVGGGTFSATLGTHAWSFDGGSGSADAVTPAFTEGDVVRVSRGTPLFVVNAPPDLSMSAFDGLTPNVGSPIPLDLTAPGAEIELPAGRYLVVVDARWDNADAEFWLPIEIVAPDSGSPSTTGALVRDGVVVAYPAGWTVAPQSLSPNLSDPREILALGTYPLRPGGSNCAQYPVNAIEDLGPTDALIWLAERNQASAGTPPRPPDLETLMSASPVDDSAACLSVPKDFVHRYGEFSEAGRDFDLYVAYGVSVTPETLSQLWGVLNGMRIAPTNGG